ncbi:GNAT family N-acetyltransferase [Kaistia adipata]|uniref:GNAT family N-acetyltransferase n=1 Tax=Kaistia adipata TaxID=166954 RepID=UPI000429025B|nr:GNAT family N-acetyltransferase [Kaistia adipata]
MDALSIRKATEADLPDLLRLYGQPDFNNGRVTTLDAARATLARMATYPDFAAYCAEFDGAIVGSFSLMIIDNLAHWGMASALVENVVVASGHQGEGIGRAMIRAAFRLAEEKGAYKVALSSNVRSTRAHEFYESLGFEKYGFSFRLEPVPGRKPSPLVGEGWVGGAPPPAEAPTGTSRPASAPVPPSPTLPHKGGEGSPESPIDGRAS